MKFFVYAILVMLYAGTSASKWSNREIPQPALYDSYGDHRWRSREIPQPHHFGQALGDEEHSREIPPPELYGQYLGNRDLSREIPQPEHFGYEIDDREVAREIPHPELFGPRHDQFEQHRDVSVERKHQHSGRGRRQSLGDLFRAGYVDRRGYARLAKNRQDPVPELYNMKPVQEMRQMPPPCMTVCPMNYSPVCASNGQTYSNKCEMDVAACRRKTILKVRKAGEC